MKRKIFYFTLNTEVDFEKVISNNDFFYKFHNFFIFLKDVFLIYKEDIRPNMNNLPNFISCCGQIINRKKDKEIKNTKMKILDSTV